MRLSTLIILATIGMAIYSVAGYFKRGSAIYAQPTENLLDNRPAIIVIHGYYGSALRDVSTKRRYFVAPQEVFFGKFSLGMFQSKLKTAPAPELEAEGMIGRVTLLPFLYEVSAYASLIEGLKESKGGRQVIPFVYDWREDLHQAVTRLDTLVKALQERGVPKIQVVAHSMGGLVLNYYLGYGPQKPESAVMSWEGARRIHSVVFMGVPFHGVMTVFRNMEKGADFPINKGILPAETVASFPSSYYLLPTGAPLLLDPSGQSLNQVLYVPAFWSRYRLGLLKSTTVSADVRLERERFIESQLANSHRFSELLQLGRSTSWPPPTGFKVLNIIGRGIKTLDGAFLVKDEFLFDEKEVKEANLQYETLLRDGDGTVAVTATAVPDALNAVTELFPTDSRHDQLWNTEKAMARINAFLE